MSLTDAERVDMLLDENKRLRDELSLTRARSTAGLRRENDQCDRIAALALRAGRADAARLDAAVAHRAAEADIEELRAELKAVRAALVPLWPGCVDRGPADLARLAADDVRAHRALDQVQGGWEVAADDGLERVVTATRSFTEAYADPALCERPAARPWWLRLAGRLRAVAP